MGICTNHSEPTVYASFPVSQQVHKNWETQNLQLRNEKVEPKRFSCVSDALKHVRLVQVFNEPAAYYEGVRCILGNGGPSGFLLGGSLR